MPSDAYATGQALWVLFTVGRAPDEAECRRAIEFLLSTQQADGSWFVKSRSKPIQVLFDNGDPHGTDQFISTPATCWAVSALALWMKGRP
jgi:N-acyl-D-amino-acid deacylase